MKQNSIADYLSCILFKAGSAFTRLMPLGASLFLGRRLGDIIYLFDAKHRAIACANIRKALADTDLLSASKIVRRAYRSFGQNLVEISFIPRIDKKYLAKYIDIENSDCIKRAFERGKGVIFLAVHEGNWELSNIICANLGFPFVLFVRDQGMPRLNALLNSYRMKQGAKLIHKSTGLRQLIEVLKANQSIGMTFDQGGKKGRSVKFFGRSAAMSTGAVKLALKYDCAIIPVFYTRLKGPYTKVILDCVYTASRGGNAEEDISRNLQELSGIYEKYIRKYPHEYLWTYKVWKYSRDREILVLSDGKAGHLNQAESAAKLAVRQLAARGINSRVSVCKTVFRSRFSGRLFGMLARLSGKRGCALSLRYLRGVLDEDSWQRLNGCRPDIVISAGDKLSAVNHILAKAFQAKSVVVMRPANLGLNKFDLAVIPRHDCLKKYGLACVDGGHAVKGRKNVVVTDGALNLVDADYLDEKSRLLQQSGLLKGRLSAFRIGVLLGGESRKFSIGAGTINSLALQVKRSAEELGADILFTTSRRTHPGAESEVKKEFSHCPRCKLLVIANEDNPPGALGGILGLSSVVVSSPESISMISEAVASGKRVIVFDGEGLSVKHRRFLENFRDKGYIRLVNIEDLSRALEEVRQDKTEAVTLKDNSAVAEALERIL
jgi:KDO2-lipid IV(A) lauroyltransferase